MGLDHANWLLLGLAPGGVCPADDVTIVAVRSYRTFSPLPRAEARGGMFSVALSLSHINFCRACFLKSIHVQS